jgi:hypothetical protein
MRAKVRIPKDTTISSTETCALPSSRVLFRALNRKLYDDKVIAEATIRGSNLQWVIVRPPSLADGPARGGYKHGVAIGSNRQRAEPRRCR